MALVPFRFPVYTVFDMGAGSPVLRELAAGGFAIPFFSTPAQATRFRDSQAPGCDVIPFDESPLFCGYLLACKRITDGRANRLVIDGSDDGSLDIVPSYDIEAFIEGLENSARDVSSN